MAEKPFGAQELTRADPSSKRRLILIATIAGVCLLVAAYSTKFLPRPTPYDDAVSHLEPGMTDEVVDDVLGKSNRFNWGWGFDDGSPSALYRVNGTNLPLIIKFRETRGNPSEVIDQWCTLVPERKRPGEAENEMPVQLVCHDVK